MNLLRWFGKNKDIPDAKRSKSKVRTTNLHDAIGLALNKELRPCRDCGVEHGSWWSHRETAHHKAVVADRKRQSTVESEAA